MKWLGCSKDHWRWVFEVVVDSVAARETGGFDAPRELISLLLELEVLPRGVRQRSGQRTVVVFGRSRRRMSEPIAGLRIRYRWMHRVGGGECGKGGPGGLMTLWGWPCLDEAKKKLLPRNISAKTRRGLFSCCGLPVGPTPSPKHWTSTHPRNAEADPWIRPLRPGLLDALRHFPHATHHSHTTCWPPWPGFRCRPSRCARATQSQPGASADLVLISRGPLGSRFAALTYPTLSMHRLPLARNE